MQRVSRSEIIHTPPNVLYDVIVDYERYPEFIDELTKVTIDAKAENTTIATFYINLIKEFTYTLALTETPLSKVEWRLVKADIMKENEGEWLLTETTEGTTEATYSLGVSFGVFVPKLITTKLAATQLPKTLKSFKARAEGLLPSSHADGETL